MTNKEAIDILNNKLNIAYFSSEDNEALDKAIMALERQERPSLRQVTYYHPKFGKGDGWYDELRHLIFLHWITKELAVRFGWKIEEAENEK